MQNSSDELLIYHIFADDGVESEPLSAYGSVVRVGWDIRPNGDSEAVQADATSCPLKAGADLAFLHPTCNRWTDRDEDGPNLIPEARELGERLADEYVIENQPGAPLRDPVVLDGSMFGLPVEYERAFETSYDVEQPRRNPMWSPKHRVENTRPKAYWKSVKGVTGDYRSEPLILSGTPACYVHHLVRPLLDGYDYTPPSQQDAEQSELTEVRL